MNFITIHTSYPNTEIGKNLISKMISDIFANKISACINDYVTNSSYIWQGEIVKDSEIAIIIKTNKNNYDKIAELISLNHCYETPQIFYQDITIIDKKYLEWLNNSI